MMLGTSSSSLIAADAAAAAAVAAAAAAAEAHDSGGGSTGGSGEVGGGAGTIPGGGFSDEEKGGRIEESERGASGGNRWPRQETLALLKIRTEMGVAFRDSSLKGPLWEEVSRKMAELGFQRSAKKCKEKFENVYKYHKRTREGRASKPDGKTYRFFDQLEALENSPSLHQLPAPQQLRQQSQALPMAATTAMAVPMPASTNPPIASHVTVSSPNPVSFSPSVNNPIISSLPSSQPQLPSQPPPTSTNPPHSNSIPTSHLNLSTSLLSDSTSSSTSSDEDIGRRHKRKRKFKDFFERLMKDVLEKQEELQRKFLETLEKRERDRMIREEAWRVQEMARMNRELDLLAQERSMTAAKDTAVMQFLQKITGQQPNLQTPITNVPPISVPVHLQPPENPSPQPISVSLPPHSAAATPAAAPATTTIITHITAPPVAAAAAATPTRNVDTSKTDNGGSENFISASSSRWPKAEVQALIRLRTNLDVKYQESGPKGPLWEEISAGMNKIGYNRSAKRCKEKWENINKYFKKVKESNKKRPEDSKTCPYFQQLEALYKEKAKGDVSYNSSYTNAIKPENPMVPIMARPEQQWPLPQDHQHDGGGHHHQQDTPMEDHESDNIDQDDDDGDEDDEEDEGGAYEIVTNKVSSVAKTATE